MFGFFKKSKKETPKTLDSMTSEEIKEFQKDLKGELRTSVREIDRQIFAADRLIKDSKRDLEKKIKEGADRNILRAYAKNLASAQKTKDKHMVQKTKLQSVEYSINQLMMNIKMKNVMGSATDIMKEVNSLAKIPEISQNIANMQMQMEKHGLINEMIEDAMDEGTDMDVDIDERTEQLLNDMEKGIEDTNKVKTKPKQEQADFDAQLKDLMS